MGRRLFLLALASLFPAIARGQMVPGNELRLDFNGYFDTFNVSVVYPDISYTQKVGESTSLSARYLVDMITAASIKSRTGDGTVGGKGDERPGPVRVDAVTGASSRGGQAPSFSFDDVRNEFGLGLTRALGAQVVSINGIYSKERDYTSGTLAGSLTRGLARNNTTLRVGLVRSWDQVYPITKPWRRDKNVTTLSAGFTQVLSKRLLVQILGSYANYNGLLSDNYQLVPIDDGTGTTVDPVHPGLRIRRAAAARFKYRLDPVSSLEMGYRYYWDSWDVASHTISGDYRRHLSGHVILGVGLRTYLQSRAFFFEPRYAEPAEYMTVDIKLDSQYSNELRLDLTVTGGGSRDPRSWLSDERVTYDLGLNIYQRHSDTPYWFNGSNDLVASSLHGGIRYRF